MERRTFVKSLSVALAGTILGVPESAQAAPKKKSKSKQFEVKDSDTLLVQSGVFGSDLFVIGMLRCSNPTAVNQRILVARQRAKYRCVLTHRSRNKYKTAYFDALLVDWLKHDDLKIHLRMVRSPEGTDKPLTGTAWMRAYADELSSTLAMGDGMPAPGGRVLTQPRFKAKQQSVLENMLQVRNDRVTKIEKVAVKNCELMQFLMTLTGVVRASEDTFAYLEARSYAKVKTIAMLRRSLKAHDFKKTLRTRQFELTIS